ncbi:MAG: hypothetical protein NZ993_04975 [Bacteroidetes bacterium]|nr:hypothetical protein [Bacteroidota bacterium]
MMRVLTPAELRALQRVRAHPAISILMPTARAFPENQQNPTRLRDLLRQAEQRLLQLLDKRQAEPYLRRLQELAEAIDWRHPQDGLALFVNADYSGAFWLPFPVSERVLLDATFATKDLVRALSRSVSYLVLALSEQQTRLWRGFQGQLQEVREHGFPFRFEFPAKAIGQPGPIPVDDGEYWQEQYRHFFRRVDQALGRAAATEAQPLVVFGVDRWIALFREVSAHSSWIVATLSGSPDHESEHELAQKSWRAVLQQMEEEQRRLVQEWREAPPGRRAAGLKAVWRAVLEGRVRVLLVEEGFRQPGRITEDGYDVEPAEGPGPSQVEDLVDELIERAIEGGAQIRFVADGALPAERIAALLRY